MLQGSCVYSSTYRVNHVVSVTAAKGDLAINEAPRLDWIYTRAFSVVEIRVLYERIDIIVAVVGVHVRVRIRVGLRAALQFSRQLSRTGQRIAATMAQ